MAERGEPLQDRVTRAWAHRRGWSESTFERVLRNVDFVHGCSFAHGAPVEVAKVDRPVSRGCRIRPYFTDAGLTRSKKGGDPWSIETFHGERC